MQKSIRLGVLVSHPIQYLSPWFQDLAKIVNLKVFYIHQQTGGGQARAGFGVEFDWDVPLLEGYDYVWLKNEAPRPGVDRFFGCDVPTLRTVLEQEDLDALLVFGWRHKSSWQAYRACRQLDVPILMKGDSGLHTPRSFLKRAVKRMLYGFVLPRFDGHLYIGEENRSYLEHYGVRDDQLFFSPLSVDQVWFANAASEAEKNNLASQLRADMGIHPDSFVFLFVGKFTSAKRPDWFLQAFLKMRTLYPSVKADAVLVGSGPLQREMDELRVQGDGHIHLAGFKNQTELPAYYQMSDSLVLPGCDPWGLVVNEAAACGIPALVSDRVGCARDLITPGKTGFVFQYDDINDMVHRMVELRQCMQANQDHIERSLHQKCTIYSFETATRGLITALAHVVGTGACVGNPEKITNDTASKSAGNGSIRAQRSQRKAC